LINNDRWHLLTPLTALVQQAGEAMMQIYQHDNTDVTLKADATPVTQADIMANDIIVHGLSQLTPGVPILSEELTVIPYNERQQWQQYWLVDPLDGTKEFIARTDEFTINIALIAEQQAVLGIVYAPALQVVYQAVQGYGARKHTRKGKDEVIKTRKHPDGEIMIAVSRRHGKCSHQYLNRFGQYKLHYCGSALKICLVAEGRADIYPRFGKTSEWDTAAGHCILRQAGGRILDRNGKELRYNSKPSLLNPEFIAVGDADYKWQQYFNE